VGKVAYHVELSTSSQVHNLPCVTQLKEYCPDFTLVFVDLPKLPFLDAFDAKLEAVLDRHLVKKGNTVFPQALIK
jgi:hypothetical protein